MKILIIQKRYYIKKERKSKKKYKKRNWNNYLKENTTQFEVNLKKRKEIKIKDEIQSLDLEVNNKNENQNIDIIITEPVQNNSKGQEIIDKEKNIIENSI